MSSSGSAEAQAISAVLGGDPGAFEAIVRRWQGPLVSLAYRYCRDRAEAEEMAQEAFIRAYRQLDAFRGESRFSTWLFAVAINTYRSYLRRRVPRTEALDNLPEPADPRPGASDLALEDEERRAVQNAVARLPQNYRDAVILHYFEGLSVSEAAGVLGVAEGTVKAQLSRARTMLRERLERAVAAGGAR